MTAVFAHSESEKKIPKLEKVENGTNLRYLKVATLRKSLLSVKRLGVSATRISSGYGGMKLIISFPKLMATIKTVLRAEISEIQYYSSGLKTKI